MTIIRYFILSGSFLIVLLALCAKLDFRFPVDRGDFNFSLSAKSICEKIIGSQPVQYSVADWSKSIPVTNKAARPLQKNNAPVVHIISPESNSLFSWNTMIPYAVTVSDKEDGQSKFGEIATTEVFVEVQYFADAARAAAYQKLPQQKEPPGYTAIKKLDCFNCHAVKSKLIGPAFQEITRKYKKTPNLELLASHIVKGSTGIWGNISMPSHPDLPQKDAEQIVKWILDHTDKPDIDYLRGTEGSFWFRSPSGVASKGAFLLKASYTDHGTDNNYTSSITDQDMIILRSGK